MIGTDFKARTAPKGVGGTKPPAKSSSRVSGLAGARSAENRRLISLRVFYEDMMGYSRSWYYRHRGRPGFPVEVDVEGWPRLVEEECLAYQSRFINARDQKQRGG